MRLTALASSLFLFAITACAERAGDTTGGNTGGTLIVVQSGNQPAPLLPPLAIDVVSRNVIDQVYDRLAEIEPAMNTAGDRGFKPRLARSWTWSPDSLSVAFSIDPRARWHDGQPVRASDVRFSFELDKDPKTGTQVTQTIANIDSVTVRDSLTPVVWYHRRTPEQFYDFVYQVYILPEHVLKDISREKLGTSDVIRRPIGSGRFRFARWEPGVRIELLSDTANYRGRAKLDRYVVSFAADGAGAVTQLLSGQADLYENVPPDVIPRVDSSGKVRLFRYPGLQYSFLQFNLRDPKRAGAPNPIFGDRRVRFAVSMALDRQAMLRNVFDTLGVLGSGPFPRSIADTSVTLPPFDRGRASALLDSAGWRTGPDGIRVKNGRQFAFSVIVPTSSSPRMRYAVLIQEQLKSIGARMDIESMDISSFITRSEEKKFDAAMGSTQTDPSISGIKQNWGTEGMAKGGQNYGSYSNLRFDALIDSALTSFDAARSKQLAHRAYQTLVDDAPAVWLYDVLKIAGVHKRVRRVETSRADGWWTDVADWWIPANERIDRDRIGLRPAQP
ncbi:MAG TPA: ABC transporter substrate-binding protein [Gemmatimonadaceae bacterium]|jgi:peptide/nickel transport system substrate-binding protein